MNEKSGYVSFYATPVRAWRVLNGQPESAAIEFESEFEMEQYFQENGISNAAYDWEYIEAITCDLPVLIMINRQSRRKRGEYELGY